MDEEISAPRTGLWGTNAETASAPSHVWEHPLLEKHRYTSEGLAPFSRCRRSMCPLGKMLAPHFPQDARPSRLRGTLCRDFKQMVHLDACPVETERRRAAVANDGKYEN